MKIDDNDTSVRLTDALIQFHYLYNMSFNVFNAAKSIPDHGDFKMKFSEFFLIYAINKSEKLFPNGASASQLSNYMHVKPQTINPIIANTEKAGIVQRKRDADDRRIIRITLTDKGRRVADFHKLMLSKRIGKLIEYLGEEKSNELADTLNDVYYFFNDNSL